MNHEDREGRRQADPSRARRRHRRRATAVASAIRNHAVTSSIAAGQRHSSQRALDHPRSTRMRARIGKRGDRHARQSERREGGCPARPAQRSAATLIPSIAQSRCRSSAAACRAAPSAAGSISSRPGTCRRSGRGWTDAAMCSVMSVGKMVASTAGRTLPRSVGPSMMPAITSPITRGWPKRRQHPRKRAASITIATATRPRTSSPPRAASWW